jgi:PST family polysaccharide transporter
MVSSVILMRLLDPGDFGIVSMAMIVLSTTNVITSLGLGMAVIQSPADRGKVAWQSFAAVSLSGTLLFLLVFFNVDTFAGLFSNGEVNNDMVRPVLTWMSVTILLGALGVIPEALLQKDMMFGRLSGIVLVSELTYIGAAVTMAFAGLGLWSLVYATLAKSVLSASLMWIACPGWDWIRPKPWDGALMRNLLRYGLHTAFSNVVSFVYSVTDNYIVARFLGKDATGLYTRSYDFTTRTVDSINSVVGQVLLPSYAQIQAEPDRLARAFLKSLRLVSFVIVPTALGMLILAPEMVQTLLKDKWMPMVPAFEVLCVVSLVKALSSPLAAVFASTGRPLYNLRAGIVVLVVMIPSVLALLGFHITGVAVAVLIAHTAGLALNLYQIQIVLPGTALRIPVAVGPALLAAGVMMGAVAAMKTPLLALAGGAHTIGSLLGLVLIGALVYGGVLFALQRPHVMELVTLATGRFGARKST